VRAALRGEPLDHVPVSLWGHDYLREWSPQDLAAHTLESYRAHHWDFIKLNPRWTFFAEAWGNRYERPTEQRRPTLVQPAVTSADDLARLDPVSARSGAFGEQLEALGLVLRETHGEVDVLYTIFSPLAVISLIAGQVPEPLRTFAHEDAAAVHHALAAATVTLQQHARLALEAGASGIFFAPLQWASRRNCTDDFYREFGRPYDLQLLHELRDVEFTVLHVCGDDNMLDLLLDYPVAAFNWADHGVGNASLAGARGMTAKTLIGGIDQQRITAMSPGEARAQAAEALHTVPTGFMLAGGCAIPPLTPPAVKNAIVAAARE